jgi:hypothetical protein
MKTRNFAGTNSEPLPQLKAVLSSWQRMMLDLTWWDDSKDSPYWYNERASLSLFAGAIWRRKGWAFEEYATEKHNISKTGKRKKSIGRGDLMFKIDGHGFVAEAKQCWLNIRSGDAIETLKDHIQLAQQDSLRTPRYGYQRLALVFATPRIHISGTAEIDTHIKRFVEGINGLSNTASAWAFPSDRREMSADKYLYPGAVVLIRPLKAVR